MVVMVYRVICIFTLKHISSQPLSTHFNVYWMAPERVKRKSDIKEEAEEEVRRLRRRTITIPNLQPHPRPSPPVISAQWLTL